MSKKNKGSAFGKATRIILAAVLIISGLYNLYKAIPKDDTEEPLTSKVIINEFVADKNNVEYCVTKVDNQKSVGADFYEVTTEHNFVVVTIKIVNNGKEPYDVNSLRFVLMEDETEYQNDSNAIMALDNAMWMDTINPGLSKEYALVYETPTTTHDSEFSLKIKPNAYVDDECVYIILKDIK